MKRFSVAFLALLCIQAIGLNLSNHVKQIDISKVETKTVDYQCSDYQSIKQRELCKAIEVHQNR